MRVFTQLSLLAVTAILIPLSSFAQIVTVPPGLPPGSSYRLIFVTSGTTAATSNSIATYNSFATTQANLSADLLALGTTWTVVGGTNGPASNNTFGVTALQNVGSSTAPVYNLAGTLVGNSMAAICSAEALLAPVGVDQAGNAYTSSVWTGSASNCGFQNRPLGGGDGSQTGQARVGSAGASNSDWISSFNTSPSTTYPIYAISGELRVPSSGPSALDGAFQIRYASNLNLGDSYINMSNTGARGAGLAAGTSASTTGALCVNVYAFSPDEQMVACCSCPVTPNGLAKLSVLDDVVYRTLTPAVPTAVVIKLYSTVPSGNTCNAATPGEAAPGLVAWGTTLHAGPGVGAVTMTETPFLPATLSTRGNDANPADIGELSRLTRLCGFIQANGSTYGICKSCTIGALGAGRL